MRGATIWSQKMARRCAATCKRYVPNRNTRARWPLTAYAQSRRDIRARIGRGSCSQSAGSWVPEAVRVALPYPAQWRWEHWRTRLPQHWRSGMQRSFQIAFFGSSLVSAYWNGAATYYRGIIRALHARGHKVTFYEPDAFDRQAHRDISDPSWAKVVVYPPQDVHAA